jgi:hypothetical protein
VGKAFALSKRSGISTGLAADSMLYAGAPHGYWHLVVHCPMRASEIVEGHPESDAAGPGLATVGPGLLCTSSYLTERTGPSMKVVHETPAPVHRNRDSGHLQFVGERSAGELRLDRRCRDNAFRFALISEPFVSLQSLAQTWICSVIATLANDIILRLCLSLIPKSCYAKNHAGREAISSSREA